MVHLEDKKISLGTLIALVGLIGVGFAAWSDVKSDIGVNTAENIHNKKAAERIEKRLERIEDKLDNLILSLD